MKLLYSAEQIREATIGLADQLNSDYKGKQIQFLGVLKGSFLFLADLVRHITVPCTVDFVRLSSYGAATASSGAVRQVMPWSDPVRDRHLVVVEEIVDSGNTLALLLAELQAEQPASLRVCTLIDKTGRRETTVSGLPTGRRLRRRLRVGLRRTPPQPARHPRDERRRDHNLN